MTGAQMYEPGAQWRRRRRRLPYASARSFFLVLGIVSILALASWIVPSKSAPASAATKSLHTRTLNGSSISGGSIEQCHLVSRVKDQCEFVRHNCPDEEAGYLSYLQLYYCHLPHAKPVAFILIVLWLGLLFSTIGIAASDFFCINLSTIASKMGISENIAGVTFLAFGNGSADIFSTFAAMKTHNGSLAIGELVGAASFITAVVAGSMAIVHPFKVARKSFVRDVSFFIVATSFSLVFLADGHLYMWECMVMIGFYVFYVMFVILWHWTLQRRHRRKLLEIAARHEATTDASGTVDRHEPFRDEEEDRSRGDRHVSRATSDEELPTMGRDGSPVPIQPTDTEEYDNDETRDRYLAELSSNMRVGGPAARGRRNTLTPIRPSLVGALEFRAVLSSVQQSKAVQSIPINLTRRYSDDPNFTTAQQHETMATENVPAIQFENVDELQTGTGAIVRDAAGVETRRGRAVSAVIVPQLGYDPANVRALGLPSSRNETIEGLEPGSQSRQVPPPSITASPLSMTQPDTATQSPSRKPLDLLQASTDQSVPSTASASPKSESLSPYPPPQRPRLQIPGHRASISQPRHTHTPSAGRTDFRLPSPMIDVEILQETSLSVPKRLRWWPYKMLPAPNILAATLFPTLYPWRGKSLWEKLLGIVAAPSVLVLTLTLPTVDPDRDSSGRAGGLASDPANKNGPLVALPLDSPLATPPLRSTWDGERAEHEPLLAPPPNNLGPPANGHESSERTPLVKSPLSLPSSPQAQPEIPEDDGWRRWLVAIQLITAPWIIVFLSWAAFSSEDPRTLLFNTLVSLLASMVALLLLFTFTNAQNAPRYRFLLCYLGFAIAVAWISTIANEVVGVLKALGTILNISDAILGLTVFAVGNSLGDLVADMTVARLGFPVMALSACFGGPLLNILLGVGVSGGYMAIQGATKRGHKHPGRPLKFKPYQIEVGGALLISGVSLLVTLAALLFIVPLRKWRMDRRMGVGLITLWVASTIANIVAEATGWSREIG